MNDLYLIWRAELCDAAIVHGQIESPVWPLGSQSSPLQICRIYVQVFIQKCVSTENVLTLRRRSAVRATARFRTAECLPVQRAAIRSDTFPRPYC